MRDIKVIVSLLAGLALGACSTPYESRGLLGGYKQAEMESGIWRVSYKGNGFTTSETIQTYWLYRVAELTLEKGFDGFEILSNIPFSDLNMPVMYPVLVAANGPVYVPYYGSGDPGTTLEGDIRLLKKPFQPAPPKIFDAAELKSALQPLVFDNKCDFGNVCPHVHHYLFPDAAAPSTNSNQTQPTAPTKPTS